MLAPECVVYLARFRKRLSSYTTVIDPTSTLEPALLSKNFLLVCCSKVIMSGVNSNVIMSGYGDENPDDERREAARAAFSC